MPVNPFVNPNLPLIAKHFRHKILHRRLIFIRQAFFRGFDLLKQRKAVMFLDEPFQGFKRLRFIRVKNPIVEGAQKTPVAVQIQDRLPVQQLQKGCVRDAMIVVHVMPFAEIGRDFFIHNRTVEIAAADRHAA